MNYTNYKKQTGSATDFLYTDIGAFQKNGGTGLEYAPSQLEGASIAKSQYQRSIWEDTVTCNHDDNLLAFIDIWNKAMDNDAPSEIYDLRITPPFSGGVAITKRVYMEVNRVANTGEDIQYVLKFREALNG